MVILLLEEQQSCGTETVFVKYNQDLDVTVVDDGIIDRNVVYSDRKCEIVSRSALKAAAERLLTNTNVVILDSLNYIKGFRYELFCVANMRDLLTVFYTAVHHNKMFLHLMTKRMLKKDILQMF